MVVVRETLSCHPLFWDVEVLLRCFELLRGIFRLALSSDYVASMANFGAIMALAPSWPILVIFLLSGPDLPGFWGYPFQIL